MTDEELRERLVEPTDTGDLRITRIFCINPDFLTEVQKSIETSKFNSKDVTKVYVSVLREFQRRTLTRLEDDGIDAESLIDAAIYEVLRFYQVVNMVSNSVVYDKKNEIVNVDPCFTYKLISDVESLSFKNYRLLSTYVGTYVEKKENFSKFIDNVKAYRRKYRNFVKLLCNSDLSTRNSKSYKEERQNFVKFAISSKAFIDDFFGNLDALNKDEIIIFMYFYDIKPFESILNIYKNKR